MDAAFAAWCPRSDSNQHTLRYSILSRARLPIPPQGRPETFADNNRKSSPVNRRLDGMRTGPIGQQKSPLFKGLLFKSVAARNPKNLTPVRRASDRVAYRTGVEDQN